MANWLTRSVANLYGAFDYLVDDPKLSLADLIAGRPARRPENVFSRFEDALAFAKNAAKERQQTMRILEVLQFMRLPAVWFNATQNFRSRHWLVHQDGRTEENERPSLQDIRGG